VIRLSSHFILDLLVACPGTIIVLISRSFVLMFSFDSRDPSLNDVAP
jgi:hypothetical protein